MKDGIGEGYTRKDHKAVSNQLFACYSKVQEARSLASVVGEDELSEQDRLLLGFGRDFEAQFLTQSQTENRTVTQSLDLGCRLLAQLPDELLDRLKREEIEEYIEPFREKEANNG